MSLQPQSNTLDTIEWPSSPTSCSTTTPSGTVLPGHSRPLAPLLRNLKKKKVYQILLWMFLTSSITLFKYHAPCIKRLFSGSCTKLKYIIVCNIVSGIAKHSLIYFHMGGYSPTIRKYSFSQIIDYNDLTLETYKFIESWIIAP